MTTEQALVQAVAAGALGLGAGVAGVVFADQLNNPLGFLLLLATPAAIAALLSAGGRGGAGRFVVLGVVAAVTLGIAVGAHNASSNEEGGAVVLVGTAVAVFLFGVPLVPVAAAASAFLRRHAVGQYRRQHD